MRRFGSRPALLATLALTATLAMGCGGSGNKKSDSSGSGLEKSTVTVASLPLVDVAGMQIAIQKGYFKQEGLTVKVKPIARSVDAVPALKSGQVDMIAGANYVSFIQSAVQGTFKTRIVADGTAFASRFMTELVPKDSPIKQPKDLEGKTIGVNILNNIQSLAFDQVLKANNVDPTKVKYTVTPFPQMGALLQQNKVDSVLAVEPFSTNIQRSQGARMILDGGAGPVKDLPVSGYVTNEDWVKKYPKTAAAFQRAVQKAQQLASTDRKAVEDVLPKYTKLNAQAASVLALPSYPASLNATRLQRLADLMQTNGLLKSKFDVKSIIFTPSSAK